MKILGIFAVYSTICLVQSAIKQNCIDLVSLSLAYSSCYIKNKISTMIKTTPHWSTRL